jgi:hypothetical protein
MEITHEPLQLDKRSWYSEKSWTYLQALVQLVFSFTEVLIMAIM